MAFLQIDFYSNALGRGAQMNALLPEGAPPAGGFPTLYLLHGMTDDYTVWMRRTSIERYAEDKRLAVIMPDTRLGWYADTPVGERYFTHVSDEVVRISRRMLPGLAHSREKTFVAGISMGGYGAFRCALKRPDTFSRAASLSGALDAAALPKLDEPLEQAAYWRDTFGPLDEIAGSEHDLFRAAEACGELRPALWMWCGTEDFLYGQNIRMRDHLRALGFDLNYSEGPGEHLWRCWDMQIRRALDWMIPEGEVLACL